MCIAFVGEGGGAGSLKLILMYGGVLSNNLVLI